MFGRYAYHVTEFDATTLGAVGEARWTYAVAKLATEHLAMNYHKQYGLPALSIRPFNIYGPRQVGEGAVHHFIVRALRGEPLTSTTTARRSAPGATSTTSSTPSCCVLADERAVGHAFNIGNPRSTRHHLQPGARDRAPVVVRLAHRVRASGTSPTSSCACPTSTRRGSCSAGRAKVDLEEGLLRTIYWYRNR